MAAQFDRDNPNLPRSPSTPPESLPLRSDAEIKKDVESFLFYDDLVRSYQIEIDVKQGSVTLSGIVDDDIAKRAAVDDALKVHGVKEVIDNIQLGRQAGR